MVGFGALGKFWFLRGFFLICVKQFRCEWDG